MKFKIGQKWLTRGETLTTIVDIYTDSRALPIIGIFDSGNELQDFTLCGKFVSDDLESTGDLVHLVHSNYESVFSHSAQDYFN